MCYNICIIYIHICAQIFTRIHPCMSGCAIAYHNGNVIWSKSRLLFCLHLTLNSVFHVYNYTNTCVFIYVYICAQIMYTHSSLYEWVCCSLSQWKYNLVSVHTNLKVGYYSVFISHWIVFCSANEDKGLSLH